MGKKSSLNSLLFTIFNDALGWGIVIVIFAPLLFDRTETLIPTNTTDANRNLIVSFLISSYAITQFFSMPIIGSLSDAFGRKKVLLWTIFGGMLSFILSALAILIESLELLFAARLLAGLFSANASTAQASIADLSTKETKTKNLAVCGVVGGVAWIVGPPIGGFLANSKFGPLFNFATPFWFIAILFFLNFIWIARGYTDTFAYKEKQGWKQEIKDLIKVSKIPRMGGWLFVTAMFYISWFLFILYFPTLFVLQFRFSQETIGFFSAYLSIFWMLASIFLQKWLGDKIPAERLAIWILGLGGVIFLVGTWVGTITSWMISFPLLSLLGSIGWISVLALTSNLAGEQNQGKIFGITQSLMSLGVFIAPLLSGFSSNVDIKLPLYLAGIFFLAMFFFASGLYKRQQKGTK